MAQVVIVGRTNVGKSTLFNRLTKSRKAIVDDQPGVTRDRLFGWVEGDQTDFILVDTGGLETGEVSFRPEAGNVIWQQTEAAMENADLVLFVVDGLAGLHPHDKTILAQLKKLDIPYYLVVNKIDGPEKENLMWEFYGLGSDRFFPISSAHGFGVGDMLDAVEEWLVERGLQRPDRADIDAQIAIIGRPNAGKSSLLNRLLGEERALVSDIAGTTRDQVDSEIKFHGKKYILIDTAGMRRKSKVDDILENLSVLRSVSAIEQADVVLHVIDATQGFTDQDARLCELAIRRKKPVVIVVNKWDLIPNKDANAHLAYEREVKEHMQTLRFIPFRFVSCLTNQRVHKLMMDAIEVAGQSRRRVSTSEVNNALKTIVAQHTPALIKTSHKRIRFYFATQVGGAPPHFVVFCNVAGEIQTSYIRYMTSRFRKMLGFTHVPIKLTFRDHSRMNRKEYLAEVGQAQT